MTEIAIHLPTLHPDQVRAYDVIRRNRFTMVRCGRRWGKTDLDKVLACDGAIKGYPMGWFAPEYKFVSEAYNEIADVLEPIIVQSSKMEGVMRTRTGGRIDFWSLDNERAGRSRKYKMAIIDEAAFTKPNMVDVWEKSILPTLLDMSGKCVVTSNTNGIDSDNFLYQIAHEPRFGFADFHAPSFNNPHVPGRTPGESDVDYYPRRDAVYAKLKADNHPLVYQQEYLAEFVDWSGAAFFSMDSLTVAGRPVQHPGRCQSVYAVIDSAVKTGKANDGTGVIYFAFVKYPKPGVVILDYDLQQIEGAMLEKWLPNVFANLEKYAKDCQAQQGSVGVWIEDKASGMILLQQAMRQQKNVHGIDNKLTALGKDERAINVSGYVYRGEVKIAQAAFDRVLNYKGTTRNHLVGQVTGFRVGDKDAARREDDLLDCFTYGISLGLGNSKGY